MRCETERCGDEFVKLMMSLGGTMMMMFERYEDDEFERYDDEFEV